MKQLTENELAELVQDAGPRLLILVGILRNVRAQLDDQAGDTFKVRRAAGSLNAIIDELANTSTPIVLAAECSRGQR